MWGKETMSFSESLLISLLGIVVVFSILVILDLAVMVISKILRLILGATHHEVANQGTRGGAASADRESELLAILASAISDDLGIRPDQLKIKSIKEI